MAVRYHRTTNRAQNHSLPPTPGQELATTGELTEIVAILDRSGSMWKIEKETEGAFNAYVDKQRQEAGRANLTLVRFDTEVKTDYRSRPLTEVSRLKLDPMGLTAL